MIVALIIMIVLLTLAAISDIGHPPTSGQQRAIGAMPPRITPAGQVPKPSPPARRPGV